MLAPVIDFLALGPEIWTHENPRKQLEEYITRIT
jgi:hypothetical protein